MSLSTRLQPILQNRKRLAAFFVFVVLASLDNAAAGVLPPLYAVIARDLETTEAGLGIVSSVYLLIVAVSAVFWGYRSDRGRRKPLLLGGTLIWGGGMVATTYADALTPFLLWQLVTAVGVGAVSSIGFSVVSDLAPARRRGLALSLWSISQGVGGAFGALLAGVIGAADWRWPFWIIAGLGFLFAILYAFTREPPRGQAEPELASLFAAGRIYQQRIHWTDLPQIWRRASNRWLLLQSFLFALAYGSTTWIPRWAIARVEAEGYALQEATIIGNLFVALFSLGSFFSIAHGHVGDRWQQQNARGRPSLAFSGLISSIPFFVTFYFLPLHNVSVPDTGNLLHIFWAVALSMFTNGWVFAVFVTAFIGLALQATDPPNWAAMITDINLPEHRGTIIGLSRLCRAVGNAVSIAAAGWLFAILAEHVGQPDNFAWGLALFQLLVLPAAYCYWRLRQTLPGDLQTVRDELTRRAKNSDS